MKSVPLSVALCVALVVWFIWSLALDVAVRFLGAESDATRARWEAAGE